MEQGEPGPTRTALGPETLAELDHLLLSQAREGKVTAAVALARVLAARQQRQETVQAKTADVVAAVDVSRSVREVLAELEAEIAVLRRKLDEKV